MLGFSEKTRDVVYSKDLLKVLGADYLLHTREYDFLEYLSCDIDILERRSKTFYDTVHIPGMKNVLSEVTHQLDYVSQMIRLQSSLSDKEQGLYSVKQLNLYFEIIDHLSGFYSAHKNEFTSEEYRLWLDTVLEISRSPSYEKLKSGSKQLIQKISNVKSISIGFNFDASLSPYESGILSVNDDYIKSGMLIDRILRMSPRENSSLLSCAPLVIPKKICGETEYAALNFSLYASLNSIFQKEIKQWEAEIADFLKERLSFLLSALPDFKFILNMAELIEKMKSAGLALTKPVYHRKEEKIFRAKNLYNPVLAMNLAMEEPQKSVVKNSLTFDTDGGIYLLTGANNGGKTVFLCAVALVQIMAQMGLPVPADSLEISPVSGIFVELPKFSSLNRTGRLAEECKIIQEIFKQLDEYALCFFDELFSSTDPVESVTLSGEILKALSKIGVRGIFSTHFHALSKTAEDINAATVTARSKIDYLVAEVSSQSQERTYKMTRRLPDGNSYARSIADKYGISCNTLINSRNNAEKEGIMWI